MSDSTSSPELLAPAGNWDCLRAAIENGADSVYFGLDCGFNARARANNFAAEDLPRLMATLHERGVRGYVTVNTLVFPSELPRMESVLRIIAAAGVDAVLVQDLGVVRLIRALCPDLPIHASTQMTLTSAECIEVAAELGIERAVLARELSISEISRIHETSPILLEAFAHGALCVAYSGQCLTSESLGGRSANRGQCAQACRLPYELICDGQDVDLDDQQYLLSPQDLAAYDLIPRMIAAGVRCFKIEGRLKTPEYVANMTRHYRQAIDAAIAGRPIEFTRTQVREMELSFSRGFSPGWLEGCDHKMLVPAQSSSKRGVFLGRVTRKGDDRVSVRLASPIARGDGVVFDGDRLQGTEQGGRIYQVRRQGKSVDGYADQGVVELSFERQAIDWSRIEIGHQIWKTDDPKLTQRLRRTFSGPDAHRRVALDLSVEAIAGEPLRVSGRTTTGAVCRVESEETLQVARKHPLDEALLRKQLGRLGATVFELRDLEATIRDEPMLPLSVYGKVRREMIQQLEDSSRKVAPRVLAEDSVLDRLRLGAPGDKTPGDSMAGSDDDVVLRVLCRTLPQLAAAISAGTTSVIADFQDIREFSEAVAMARQGGVEIMLATPRIQKPTEASIFALLGKHEADGILVRNLAGLAYFAERQVPIAADYSLNAANDLTLDFLRSRGAGRVTVSYDLNRDQLFDLVDAGRAEDLEVVIYQHMPMFHMEHCVFCAVLSPGTNKSNCGRPCDFHEVKLRDRVGMEHPLKADVGCRNTLFNAVPQSSAEVVPDLLARKVRNYRIELLDHSDADVTEVIDLYRRLLKGQVNSRHVWTTLNALNRVGVTRGTLESSRDPLAIL